MNKTFTLLAAALMAAATPAAAEVSMNVFDHVTFYDGYLVDKIPEDAPDEGCLRLYTFLNAKQITQEQLEALGERLTLDVTIYPLCDNYDRIGSVNLALIPKGQESYTVCYDDSDPIRIELGRFITPFMNKNRKPNEVPYVFEVDYISNLMRDAELREKYDFWLELMVFGVPYAAQSEVVGCAGCNDVWQGSVDLVTDDTPAPLIDTDVFVPISIRTADYRADRGINNYNEACTDELGKTVKTYEFEVPKDCSDARVVFVISNHGAGTNGEEYSRRDHFIYVDDELALTFKPGRQSCEPFRDYNTQANGIYGWRPKSDLTWQSFSNWCPGDVIDNRFVEMGEVKAGKHSLRVEVPDAVFYGNDGYFPVSLFFQGTTEGLLPYNGVEICTQDYSSSVAVEGSVLKATASAPIRKLEVYALSGELRALSMPQTAASTMETSLAGLGKGVYIVAITTSKGVEAHKFCF